MDSAPAPWWARLFPDTRGWIALGFFGLVGYILHIIATTPSLATNELFVAIASSIVTGGLIGGVVGFFYGQAKDAAAAIANAAPRPTQPPQEP